MNIVLLHSNPLYAIPQAAAVVQDRMYENARRQSKGKEVRHCVGGREVKGRVIVIRRLVESILAVQHTAHVVDVAVTVVWVIVIHREIGEVPCVGVIHARRDNPEKEDKSEKHVNLCPPREHEGTAYPCDFCPVEC